MQHYAPNTTGLALRYNWLWDGNFAHQCRSHEWYIQYFKYGKRTHRIRQVEYCMAESFHERLAQYAPNMTSRTDCMGQSVFWRRPCTHQYDRFEGSIFNILNTANVRTEYDKSHKAHGMIEYFEDGKRTHRIWQVAPTWRDTLTMIMGKSIILNWQMEVYLKGAAQEVKPKHVSLPESWRVCCDISRSTSPQHITLAHTHPSTIGDFESTLPVRSIHFMSCLTIRFALSTVSKGQRIEFRLDIFA